MELPTEESPSYFSMVGILGEVEKGSVSGDICGKRYLVFL